MERSSNFTADQQRREELVCSDADSACRGSPQRRPVPAHSGTAAGCTGSSSAVARCKSGGKENFGEKGIFSPHRHEASRADDAATTRGKMKGDGAEGQEEVAKVSELLQHADGDSQLVAHRPGISNKSDREESVKDPNAFKHRTPQQTARIKVGTQARSLVSLEVLSESTGVAANAAALAEQEVDSSVASARGTLGASSVAEEETPASCAAKEWECPAAAAEDAPGYSLRSSTTSTTSRKDEIEDASSCQISSAPCTNYQLELATHDEQMPGDTQQLSEKSAAETSNKNEEELKAHLFLEVRDGRLPQGRRDERRFVDSGETESRELRATCSVSADDTVKGKNERSAPANPQVALSSTGNEPQLALHDAAEADLADFGEGERSQSHRKEAEALDRGAIFTEFPSEQLRQPQHEGAANASVCCTAVQKNFFFKGKVEDAGGDSSSRLPELRQFTLELLYAVSLLRPFGKKGHSGLDQSDCLRSQEVPAADQREGVTAMSTAHLALRSGCFGEEQEKGWTADSLAAGEEQLQAGRIDKATFDHQRLPELIPATLHLRQRQGCSGVDYVAALKRRVTDAILLCAGEKTAGALSTARLRSLKGTRGGFEGEVSDLYQELRSDGEDAADAALATVAFAGGQSPQNSFEAFAEKIGAAKTTKELVVLLCGYFGPLLHLLQEYMNGSESQLSGNATTKARVKSKGASTGDCGLFNKVAAQAFSQRTQSGLHRQQQALHEKQTDETVKGVNAILHVLTETDQLAADVALDRVCERLFRLHYDGEASGSSALDSPRDFTGASRGSEFMRQTGKGREKWHTDQQQTSERTSLEYPLSHTADDTGSIHFGHAVGEESAACAALRRRKTEQQSRSCEDGAETCAFLSLSPTAEGALYPSAETKQEDTKAGNDASAVDELGSQTQVSGVGGTTLSGSGGCIEGPASYNSSCMSAGEESGHRAGTTSAGASPPVSVGFNHGSGKADRAKSLVGVRQTPDLEREFRGASQLPFQRQQLQEGTVLRRAEVEEQGCSLGESVECDESQSSRTAWLAAQLSTPLDVLGGGSIGETEGTRNEKVSEEVAHILETLETAVFQPSASPLQGASAARTVEKQTAECVVAPYAWETSVQLVLRMLREQEKQWPLPDAAPASLEDRCLSVRERNPKRRAVLNEREAFEAVHRRALIEEKALHSFVWDTKGDRNKAHGEECMAGTSPHVEPLVAESPRGPGQGVKATKYSSTGQEVSIPAADQAAVPGRIAAAAAVERAAVAVAQQGAVAAVEHAGVGGAEFMRRIRDLGGAPPAGLAGPPIPLTTGLAASTCFALERAVEYVGPLTNDEKEEQLAEKQSKEMFAELDNQGLDSLVSQLLKLAERPTEQRRGQDIYGEQLLRLLHGMQGQGYPECKQWQQADHQQSSSQNPLRRQRQQPYQRHRQQHAQWEGKTAGDSVRGGGNFDGSLIFSSSPQQRGTDAQSTTAVMVEKMRVSSKAAHLGSSHTAAVPSPYLRSSGIYQGEEQPARMSPALDKCTGVSSISSWPPRASSSGSIHLPLDTFGSTESAFPSPAGSPCVSRCGKYLSDTPTLSVTRAVGPFHRQSSVKRSPWRSAEPYSSSASTVAASPVAASAQSVGSPSLNSSPFSLLPTSATTVFQPKEAALESRSPGAGEASTFVGFGGGRLIRGARVGMIEDLARGRPRSLRDSFSHQNSSRLNESRQRRVSLEGVLPSFSLLPARVPSADSSSSSTTTTTLGGTFGVEVHPGERVTGVENEHRSNVTAGSLYAHVRVSDFFDVSASARAHLLEEPANASAPIVRAFSAFAPAVLLTQEGGSGRGRRQEPGGPQDVRVQADASAQQASAGPSEFFRSRNVPLPAFPEEMNHGGTKAGSSKKFERARRLSPCLSSSTGGRSSSDSGPSTVPAVGLQPFDFSRPAFREAGTLTVDTKQSSTTEQSSNQRIDHRLLGNAESRSCAARPTSVATLVTPARTRGDQEQHRFGLVTSVAPGQRWAHASASSAGRTGRQQQQSSSDAEFWPKASAPADRSLLRSRCTGGGRQEDRTSTRYCASSPVSPVFTRAALPGVRREAATVGCVGAGGADCVCGGALCLYRSAVSGVVYDKSGQKWTARWNEDGRQHKRTFAAAKYGFLTAKMKAEACRGEARERTALAKHEALQQQQQSLAQRLGLFTAASPAGDGSQSRRCTAVGSSATAAAREVAGQRRTRP